jgi:hypothetical protein
MGIKPAFSIDLRKFYPSSETFIKGKYPEGLAKGFRDLSERARNNVRDRTRNVFKLNSDYITNGIKSLPSTDSQVRAAERAIRNYGDVTAAVYLRGSNKPSGSLDFMVDHEDGNTRQAHKNTLAIPTDSLRKYKYRTARGRVKKSWKPTEVLKYYNSVGPNKSGATIKRRRGGKGKAFIMRGSGGKMMIARRLSSKRRPLEFLYSFNKTARIKKVWGFETTVRTTVSRQYEKIIANRIKNL